MRMRLADSPQADLNRIRAAELGGLALILIALALALSFSEPRWFVLAGIGGSILAGAAYIAYRRRRGPLDWDQHMDDRVDSNFHHL